MIHNNNYGWNMTAIFSAPCYFELFVSIMWQSFWVWRFCAEDSLVLFLIVTTLRLRHLGDSCRPLFCVVIVGLLWTVSHPDADQGRGFWGSGLGHRWRHQRLRSSERFAPSWLYLSELSSFRWRWDTIWTWPGYPPLTWLIFCHLHSAKPTPEAYDAPPVGVTIS